MASKKTAEVCGIRKDKTLLADVKKLAQEQIKAASALCRRAGRKESARAQCTNEA